MEALIVACKLTYLQARGMTTTVTEKMVPFILSKDLRAGESGSLSAHAVSAWYSEKHRKQPSLTRLLVHVFPKDVIVGLIGSLLWSMSTCMVRPLVLKALVDAANDGEHDEALKIAGFLVLVLQVEAWTMYVYRHHFGNRLASGVLGVLSVLIQRKGLQLAPGVAGETTERTLINNDVIGLAYQNWQQLHMMPACIMSAVLGSITVLYAIGFLGLIGLATMVTAVGCSIKLAGMSKRYEQKRIEATSLRLGVTARTLNSIKAVKFCAWEDQFMSNIFKARQEECRHLRYFRSLQTLNASIGRVTPVLCAAVTYIVLAASGVGLEPGEIFAVLSVFQSLRLPLILIPMNLTILASFAVVFGRILRFLLLPDIGSLSKPADEKNAVCVMGEKMTYSWPGVVAVASAKMPESFEKFCLSCGNLTIPWGARCALVGSVGAGKSSLICTMFGGLSRNVGNHDDVPGILATDLANVGYVPQRAFVVSGTVLQNVVFGRAWDPDLFVAAVHAAALDNDFLQLPNGKDTEIGEQGVTLSGGQKQRINIARAVYGCPRLLVLDDPLAAVDMKVARQIFNRVVLQQGGEKTDVSLLAPKGQTVIMALNQFNVLHKFDHVVYLESGTVVEQGRPEELCNEGGRFAKFVNSDIGSVEDVSMSRQVTSGAEEEVPVQQKQNLVIGETRNAGFINKEVYRTFFKNLGFSMSVLTFILFTIAYGSMGFTDFWLKLWVEQYSDNESGDVDNLKYAIVYAMATLSFLFFQMWAGLVLGRACVNSSKFLHDQCISHLLRAPVSFFEETPSGRLLSRFGADLAQIDLLLAMMVDAVVTFLFTLLVLTVTICILAPPMIAIMVVAGVVFFLQWVAQDRTSREVKRMANNALSPTLNIVGELNEENARLLVRAMKFENRYTSMFAHEVDILNNANMVTNSILLLGALYAYILAFVVASISAILLLKVLTVSAADIGLSLTYAFMLPYFLQIFAQVLLLLNVSMTALERMLQTQGDNVSQEPAWKLSDDSALVSKAWPTSGKITFSNVSLVYRPGLPPALKDCSFEIPGGAKVGCVGRTGAGKSSLFVLLFRIVDAASGTIRVDDVPISSIGLHTLRAKMAIIPQEPLLLEGSLRINIDPFEQHSDEEVDAVLKRVGLVGSDKQPHQLSFGERQLLQMARTLLRQVSIVVMDEPTSNIDPNTDETLQRVVREDFGSQTVVTIAHRLDTVIDNDKIMVLDAGRLVEYDAPALLLQDPNSHLSGMVNQQGERKAQITRGRLCQKLATQGIEIEIGPLAETPPKEVQPESDEKAELSVKLKSTDEANACLLTPFRFCWVLPGKLAS